ncbi:MAG: P-loop NTPase fold protein [Pseudomonadota bacterium]
MLFYDQPITAPEDDRLARRAYSDVLADVIRDSGTQTPLNIGVFGDWGSGKSSILQCAKHTVDHSADPKPITIWFSAWLFSSHREGIWRSLILLVVAALAEQCGAAEPGDSATDLKDAYNNIVESLYRSLTLTAHGDYQVNWSGGIPLMADFALRAVSGGVFDMTDKKGEKTGMFSRFAQVLTGDDAREAISLIERETHETFVGEVRSVEQFRDAIEKVLRLSGISDGDGGRRLAIFVDDLDRCQPEDAINTLEAIKLFLDLPGVVFVFGMDEKLVSRGLLKKYGEAATNEENYGSYLDKIIHLQIELPLLSQSQVLTFLEDETLLKEPCVKMVSDLVSTAVPNNPRSLKKSINTYLIERRLKKSFLDEFRVAFKISEEDSNRYLCKSVLIRLCFPKFFDHISNDNWRDLFEVEKHAKGEPLASHLNMFGDDKNLIKMTSLAPYFDSIPKEMLKAFFSGEIDFVNP